MTTRKTTPTIALIAVASAASFAVSAATLSPEKYSPPFNADNTVLVAAIQAQPALPRAGEVSSDGLFVYSGNDRGWVARSHSYEIVAGQFVHTADCLPYNAPKPIAAVVPAVQRGGFAEH